MVFSDETRAKLSQPPSALDYANAAHDILKDIDPKTLVNSSDLLLYALAAGVLSIASSQTT